MLVSCGCLSHNGFLTRKGYEAMRAGDGRNDGVLTPSHRAVTLDSVFSVSALETETGAVTPSEQRVDPKDPPQAVQEVTDA